MDTILQFCAFGKEDDYMLANGEGGQLYAICILFKIKLSSSSSFEKGSQSLSIL